MRRRRGAITLCLLCVALLSSSERRAVADFRDAVLSGDVELVRRLLEQGDELEVPIGTSPLIWAACVSEPRIVELLLVWGAQVDDATRSDGRTALHQAVVCDQVESVQILLERGADARATDALGDTALHMLRNHPAELLGILLSSGATLDASNAAGEQPIHSAAARGSEASVQALLDAGVHVNELGPHGATPLFIARHQHRKAIAELLVKSGGTVAIGDPEAFAEMVEAQCQGKPVAGKVQMIAEGMDQGTVRLIICAAEELRVGDGRDYWYYPTGTIVFEKGKVLETSQDRIEPGALSGEAN